MAVLISSVCCTLILLAFCQIIIETILPEGSTKRYVVFIAGLIAVLVIVTTFTMSGSDALKAIYSKTAEIRNVAQSQENRESSASQTNPYKEYIEKLIDQYR